MPDNFSIQRSVPASPKVQPFISVIIPTYNRLELLQEAIASVKAQTYTNWELIIVDDGSTDGTVEVIQKMNDPKIHVVSLSHTGHIGNVTNIGIKESSGEWLAFLDSDDIWIPGKLEWQLETLQKENKRWVYGKYQLIDENKEMIHKSSAKFYPFSGEIIKEIILTKAGVTICSVMLERKLFEEIGGFSDNPDIRFDYEFTLRMALRAEASVVAETVVLVREHSGRITKARQYPYERTAKTYEAFIKQQPGKKNEQLARKRLAFLLSEASIHRFANREIKIAIRQLAQSFWLRDGLRHWLSSLKKGIHATFKKHISNTGKKRKKENVAAYNS